MKIITDILSFSQTLIVFFKMSCCLWFPAACHLKSAFRRELSSWCTCYWCNYPILISSKCESTKHMSPICFLYADWWGTLLVLRVPCPQITNQNRNSLSLSSSEQALGNIQWIWLWPDLWLSSAIWAGWSIKPLQALHFINSWAWW